jgi:hypothetical protein
VESNRKVHSMNKPLFKGLAATLAYLWLLFHVAPASAVQWHLLSHDSGATIYYDAASIAAERGVVKVWTRTDFDPPNLIGDKKETDDRALFAFRCHAREVGLASLLAYDADGNEIARALESDIRFEQVEPVGPAKVLMKIACTARG